MDFGGIPIAGSFQKGQVIYCDNPREEVWAYVSRMAVDFPGHPALPSAYSSIRLRQAVHFRSESRDSPIITKPLSLYYSALNLARSALYLRDRANTDRTVAEHFVKRLSGHGLGFHGAASPLELGATVKDSGTFSVLAQAVGANVTPKETVTFQECLAAIPEMLNDIYGRLGSRVVPVNVSALFGGPTCVVRLHFPQYSLENWQTSFPALANICLLENSTTLRVPCEIRPAPNDDLYVFCSSFCESHLVPAAHFGTQAQWFVYRNDDLAPHWLTRELAYFIGLFILASAVRYEPEPISGSRDGYVGWIIERFLAHAERYFPQMILSLCFNNPMYFEHHR